MLWPESQRADKVKINLISPTYALLDCSIFDFIWIVFLCFYVRAEPNSVHLSSKSLGCTQLHIVTCKNLILIKNDLIIYCAVHSYEPLFLGGRAQPMLTFCHFQQSLCPFTHKAPHTCRSELFRLCTDAKRLLSFLVCKGSRESEGGSAPVTFQSAQHRQAFFLLRNRNQQLTCHFCFDGHLWKAGHPHTVCLKCLLTTFH